MIYKLYLHDCLAWLDEQPEASFEAIITDPPYGWLERIFCRGAGEAESWTGWSMAHPASSGRQCPCASAALHCTEYSVVIVCKTFSVIFTTAPLTFSA